jgi:hypothetical protein
LSPVKDTLLYKNAAEEVTEDKTEENVDAKPSPFTNKINAKRIYD